MRKYSKLLLPALIVGGVLFAPANIAEAKVTVEGGKTYDSLSEAVAEVGADTATFNFDEAGDTSGKQANILPGSNYTINGNGATMNGIIELKANEAGEETHVTINNLTIDGQKTRIWGIHSQNQETEPTKLYLTVNDSTITNHKNKAIYLTNAQELTINNTKFINNAYASGDHSYVGDYAVDVNLIGIQGAKINISNSTFSDVAGRLAHIKVGQRGGVDDIMTDVPYYRDASGENRTDAPAATVSEFNVTNCDFSGIEVERSSAYGDVVVGDDPNADGSARASVGRFDVSVTSGKTPTKFYVRQSADAEKDVEPTVVEPGKSLVQLTGTVELKTDDPETIDMKVGSEHQLSYYFGDNANETVVNAPAVEFASSDSSIASVAADGRITATKAGRATITAKYGAGEYTWNVNVADDTAGSDVDPGTDTPTPDVTEPVQDTDSDNQADVAAPNTGSQIVNTAAIVGVVIAAIAVAVYATRFASAKK